MYREGERGRHAWPKDRDRAFGAPRRVRLGSWRVEEGRKTSVAGIFSRPGDADDRSDGAAIALCGAGPLAIPRGRVRWLLRLQLQRRELRKRGCQWVGYRAA